MSTLSNLKIVFMGTPEFSVPALKALSEQCKVVAVYTQPDKPVGRGMQTQCTPVKKLALEKGIPVYTPEKVSVPEEVEKLKIFDADFFVIVAYGQILKLPVIETPKLGCINIHSSLLPRWRGAAPIQWAILGGDQETGITTMKIVPKLDAGDILLQAKTRISETDTAKTIHDRLSSMGAELILDTLNGIAEGSLQGIKQEEALVTYAHKLTKEMEALDCTKTVKEMDLAVRALNPWPGTSLLLKDGIKIKIKAGKQATQVKAEKPGMLFTQVGNLYVRCLDGSYQIEELQEEGKKQVKTVDFLNGLKGRGVSLPLPVRPAQGVK